MKKIVDGRIEPAGIAMDELPSGAAGVFETLLVREGKPVFFAEHWQRFEAGCHWYGVDLPADAAAFEARIVQLAAQNGVAFGAARFAAWHAESGRITWRIEVTPPRPHMALATFRAQWGPLLPVISQPVQAFKHLNRAAWTVAMRAARAAGFDEALLCDASGRVVEGGTSNLFFVRGGKLHTPALSCGPLPGILRDQVIACARAIEIPVIEGMFCGSDVESAEEVWITNSLLGIRAVSAIGELALKPPFPVLDRLRTGWQQRHGWDPVVISTADPTGRLE
jgi:branched-subunit amino acid aminotransferase/4-amino-4-deoxychorismate lyase